VYPTLRQLNRERIVYKGAMYFGLMITNEGIVVLEINCRFGDPETQVQLPLLESDLFELLWRAAVQGSGVMDYRPIWSSKHAVCLVLAAPGYPDKERLI